MPTASKISTMGDTVPYITTAELRRSPIGNQLMKLVPRSSDADNEAELARIIMRVSAMINSEVTQNLTATVDTEVGKVRVDADGHLNIHTRCNPIIDVLSIEVGESARSLRPVSDLSALIVDPWRITIPDYGRPGSRLWARFVYVNGFPVTTLTAPAAAGDTTLSVGNTTGILPVNLPPSGRNLTIADGSYLEDVAVSAVDVDTRTITVSPLLYDHDTGVGINDLPEDIEEATLLLISRLHDTWSLSMGAISTNGTGAQIPGAVVKRAMCDAAVMLTPYRRMW